WDLASGKLSGEYPVGPALHTPGAGSLGYKGPVLQWLPGAAGWLINGHVLYHRPSARIVWVLRTRAPFVNTVGLLDRDHLLAPLREGEQDYLVRVPVPWPDIEAGLKAMTSPAPAPLRPGQAVTLQVEVGDLRLADPEQARVELRQVLTDR